MRQVNRNSVGVPSCLAGDLSGEIEKVAQGHDPKGSIYRAPEVVSRLRSLYLDKCFLCECPIVGNGEVEHFLPWHKDAPARSYDWKNLQWSCSKCNGRKRGSPYCERPHIHQPAQKTNLIDPSNPPFGCSVDELISFDKDCNAVVGSNTKYTQETVVQYTIEFLNHTDPLEARRGRFKDLFEFIWEANKTCWEKLQKMDPIEPTKWSAEERSQFLPALDRADALYVTFLTEKAPFSVCMKAIVVHILRCTIDDFRRMSNAYRQYKGVPLLSC